MRAALVVFILITGCGFKSPSSAANEPDAAAGSASLPCPPSYNVTKLPGPSRYRLIISGGPAWEQSDACNQDMPGATHLVVIETTKELGDIANYIRPGLGAAGDSVWIGAVQLSTATSPGDAWFGLDGNPLIDGWGGSEPNDNNDNNESNHEEQFVRMTRTQPNPYFIDDGGGKSYGALCECDGKPIAATMAAVIDGYRPPS